MKESRRLFLKNFSLATVGLGLTPLALKGDHPVNATPSPARLECDPITLDYYGEGPFYTEDAPTLTDGVLAPENEEGTRLFISGTVKSLDCQEVIANAQLDLWHASHAGEYDNEGFHLRGKVTTNSDGFYSFETIWPGKYLNGSSYRPRHIHVKISAPGYDEFTTQLYFEGDTSIEGDAAASIDSGVYDASHRIIALSEEKEGLVGTWDIVIDAQGTIGIDDMHLSKGILYQAFPNPFQDKVAIRYGVFKSGKISIEIVDTKGQIIDKLVGQNMEAEKYETIWEPSVKLPKGYYYCILKLNGVQVHSLKLLKG